LRALSRPPNDPALHRPSPRKVEHGRTTDRAGLVSLAIPLDGQGDDAAWPPPFPSRRPLVLGPPGRSARLPAWPGFLWCDEFGHGCPGGEPGGAFEQPGCAGPQEAPVSAASLAVQFRPRRFSSVRRAVPACGFRRRAGFSRSAIPGPSCAPPGRASWPASSLVTRSAPRWARWASAILLGRVLRLRRTMARVLLGRRRGTLVGRPSGSVKLALAAPCAG